MLRNCRIQVVNLERPPVQHELCRNFKCATDSCEARRSGHGSGFCPDFHGFFAADRCRFASGRGTRDDTHNAHGRFRSVGRVRFEERRRFIRPTVLQSPLLATQRVVEVAADDRGGQAGFPTELGIQLVEDLGDQLLGDGDRRGIDAVRPRVRPRT